MNSLQYVIIPYVPLHIPRFFRLLKYVDSPHGFIVCPPLHLQLWRSSCNPKRLGGPKDGYPTGEFGAWLISSKWSCLRSGSELMIAESTLVTKPEAVTKEVLEFEDSEKDVGKSSKSCKHVFLPNRVWSGLFISGIVTGLMGLSRLYVMVTLPLHILYPYNLCFACGLWLAIIIRDKWNVI